MLGSRGEHVSPGTEVEGGKRNRNRIGAILSGLSITVISDIC